jgi:hypothetical protein
MDRQKANNPLLLIALTVAIFAAGCSKDDDTDSATHLNPPAWIQGEWEGIDGRYTIIAAFTKTNAIIGTESAGARQTIDIVEYARNPLESDGKVTLVEHTTSNTYEFGARSEIGGAAAELTFKFRRVSDNTIQYILLGLESLTCDLKRIK